MTTTLPEGPICPRCGNLGEHTCPVGRVSTGGVLGGVHDTRVGTVRQWALRLDCARCDPPHADRDELRPLWRDDADQDAADPSVNGHPATLLTRVVVLPPWREHGVDEPAAVGIVWVNDEQVEIRVNGETVADANHDEHGWDGMEAVINTATAIAKAAGMRVETVGTPNL